MLTPTKQDGFSILEVMIASSILVVVVLGVSTVMAQMFDLQRQMQIKNSIEVLRMNLVTYPLNLNGIKNTLLHPENSRFRDCVQSPNAACGASGLDLKLRSLDDSSFFTGLNSNPELFDQLGAPCTQNCVFEGRSSFSADCVGCTAPTGYFVHWSFLATPSSLNANRLHSLKPREGKFYFTRACLLEVLNGTGGNVCNGGPTGGTPSPSPTPDPFLTPFPTPDPDSWVDPDGWTDPDGGSASDDGGDGY